MRIFATAMIIVVSATPAFSQIGFPTQTGGGRFLKTDEEVRQEKERESGYKSGLRRYRSKRGRPIREEMSAGATP